MKKKVLIVDDNSAMAKKSAAGTVTGGPLGEDMEFFRRHDEALFRKLEAKMMDLEAANQRLKLLEESYRLSFDNVTDVIYTIGPDLKMMSMSQSVEKVLGYKPEEFIGRSVADLKFIFSPETLIQAVGDLSRVLTGETVSALIYRFVAKDGTARWGEVNGSPIVRDGRIVGMISVARDITDRKKAEEELKQSEKKYRELYDFLPIPVYEMDLEGNVTSANRAIYEIIGATEEDLEKGFKVWRALTPEGMDTFRRNIRRMLEGERIEGTEYTIKRLDGSLFPAVAVTSVITRDGRPVGFRGAVVDITERRRSEEELRRMNAFLDSIVENIPNMIVLKDAAELRYVRLNRAGEDLLGHSRDEAQGKTDADFFSKQQAKFFMERDREILLGKELVDIPQETFQTRDKGQRILHTRKAPILNAKGEAEYLLGVSEDITERMKSEERLQQALDSLNKAVSATLQVMASAVEVRDPYKSGHQTRVADLAFAIALEMGLSVEQLEVIRLAASIHDIGKLSVPADILSKSAKLTDIEYARIREHSQKGFDILKKITSPWPLADIVFQHHERWDGSGYPRGLKGKDILIEARILGVADVVEAMTSPRPHRRGLSIEAALDEIEKNQGRLYDPDVAQACLRIIRENRYHIPEH